MQNALVTSREFVLERLKWQRKNAPVISKNSTVMKPLSMVHLEEFSGIGEFVKVAPIPMAMTTPWPIPDAAEIITMFAISSRLWYRLSICQQDDRLIKSAGIGPNKSIIYFLDLSPWLQDLSPRLFLH